MMEFKKIRKRVFKEIKGLDAEIRFIENEHLDGDDDVYWTVEIGLCLSMGERGYAYTLFFDAEPTEKDIIIYTKEHIREQIIEFETGYLGAYEEQQLKILKGVKQ